MAAFTPVPGLPGYVVDSQGSVYGPRGQRKLTPHADGYVTFSVRLDGKVRNVLVHRAVFEAFHGPVPAGLVVRHMDGDPANNDLTNLAVGTHMDNTLDAVRHGTKTRVLTDDQVREIRRQAAAGVTRRALAARFGVSLGLVNDVVWRVCYATVPQEVSQ